MDVEDGGVAGGKDRLVFQKLDNGKLGLGK